MEQQETTFLGGQRTLKHVFVSSSTLLQAVYDTVTETLTMEFRNGSVYRYPAVGLKTVEELFEAPSAGAYFAKNIRPYNKGTRMDTPKSK